MSRYFQLPLWMSALSIFLVSFCTPFISAQLGRVIEHPEALAGVWEAPGEDGVVTGMLIGVDTHIDRLPDDKSGRPQSLDQMSIGLYCRAVPGDAPSGFGFFSVGFKGETRWDGTRLQIDWQDRTGLDWVHVNLIWEPLTKTWTGDFARHSRNRRLIFKRPHNKSHGASPLAGTWFDGGTTCLHIAQAQDESLSAWSDEVRTSGLRYANHITPPPTFLEIYGARAKVGVSPAGFVNVELGAEQAICCSRRHLMKLAPDEQSLKEAWRSDHVTTWKRMPGDTCLWPH